MVTVISSGHDLVAILALKLEEVLTHVDAVGNLGCGVARLLQHSLYQHSPISFLCVLLATEHLLTQGYDMVAARRCE